MTQHNTPLTDARRKRDDEFYTPREMIEAELAHYPAALFKGKRILCNCDDPMKSEFFRYFRDNFGKLKLRRVVGLRYAPSALFEKGLKQSRWQFPSDDNTPPYKRELWLDSNGDKRITGMVDLPPGDHGGFDGDEGKRQLKDCDIVVTNPPFSKFREFMSMLMRSGKKFLVIGNLNGIVYKEIFPLIHSGKMWLGAASCKGAFIRPKGGDSKLGFAVWFTNLSHERRGKGCGIPLTAKYTAKDYPTYDNYAAIEVARTADIPDNYYGEMGVPVSYLQKHNPRQFEIIWTVDRGGDGKLEHLKKPHTRYDAAVVRGDAKYKRVIIKRADAGANWIERKDLDRNPIYGIAGGFVYVAVIPGDPGWYKIGKAENVAKRVKGDAFSRHADPKVVMSLEVHNRHQAEKQVHNSLRQRRKKGKEWFKLPQKELEEELSAIAGKSIRLWQ